MKKLLSYLIPGIILVIMVMVISCSKEEASPMNPESTKSTTSVIDKTYANGIHGNEFVTSQLNSVMTHYNGMTNFSNNTGNNNFTGSGPGSGGGNEISGTGSFTVFNTTYPITIGGFEGWGEGWFSIYLIHLDQLDEANAVVFDILSPSENEIEAGTYYYSDVSSPYTFHWAQVILSNYDNYEFASGTITISHSGNSYSINIDGTLENGGSITGRYSGTLLDLGGEPEPPQTGSMSATLFDGTPWIAERTETSVYLESFDIYGRKDYGSSAFTFKLKTSMVYPGSQLTLSNGGITSIHYYSIDEYIYADTYAVVDITFYTPSGISGTFEFTGKDYNNNSYPVTMGIFTNIPISLD